MNSEFKRVLLGLMISHIPKELKSEYKKFSHGFITKGVKAKCSRKKE